MKNITVKTMKIEQNKIGTRFYLLFTDPLFDLVWQVGNKWIKDKNSKFLDKLERYSKVDLKDFDPIYYCHKCQRLEDGCHRSWTRKNKGQEGCEVIIGRTCWKKMEHLHLAIKKLIEEKKLKTKDDAWTKACETKKWNILSNINFTGKTYLDVGSQSGYSAFRGWNYGAVKIDGVEIRKEIFEIAEEVKKILSAEEVTFHNKNWLEVKDEFWEYDIVSCMGLLHYFDVNIYDSILEDLCNKAKSILILDLRIWDNITLNHHVIGPQTLITRTHLTDILKQKGFNIIQQVDNTHKNTRIQGKRELWVMEKI